jgi:Icc-related predicted phosphoesterase
MIIVALTDIHGQTGNIGKIAEVLETADVVLLTGDITHFGHDKEAKAVFRKIIPFNDRILAVSGNCDNAGVSRFLSEQNCNIQNEMIQFNGYSFYGLGGSLPCPGKTPAEYTEEEYGLFVSSMVKRYIPESQDILLSHQPPFNTVNDEVEPGIHVGSRVIREFIEWLQPVVVFTGHIHEGIGIDKIGKARVINPGPFIDVRYAYAQIIDGQIIDLEIRKI